jgi:hypothetical protein
MVVLNSTLVIPSSQNASNAGWKESLLTYYGVIMLLCGLEAGIFGVIAVTQKHERSWMVWLAILPGAFVLLLMLREVLLPY